MSVLFSFRTYIVSAIVGGIAHWAAAHPGTIDPFYTGTLIGVILHALHMDPTQPGSTGTGA
jgi:hypothetical protein